MVSEPDFVLNFVLCAYTPTPHCCQTTTLPGLVLQAGLDIRAEMTISANLNGDGVNSSSDGRSWDSPKEWWCMAAQSLHSDFNSICLCVQSSLQHQLCKALETKWEQLAFHHSHNKKNHFYLLTHIDNLSHVTFFLISISWGVLNTSAEGWHQLSKCSVKEIAYPGKELHIRGGNCLPISAFLEHQLTNTNPSGTCKQRTQPVWHVFVLSTLTCRDHASG